MGRGACGHGGSKPGVMISSVVVASVWTMHSRWYNLPSGIGNHSSMSFEAARVASIQTVDKMKLASKVICSMALMASRNISTLSQGQDMQCGAVPKHGLASRCMALPDAGPPPSTSPIMGTTAHKLACKKDLIGITMSNNEQIYYLFWTKHTFCAHVTYSHTHVY